MNKKILVFSILATGTACTKQLPSAETVEKVRAELTSPTRSFTKTKANYLNNDKALINNPKKQRLEGKPVAQTKLSKVITELFDQHLTTHKINPEMVAKLVPKVLIEGKQAVANNVQTIMKKTYRSELLLNEIDALVAEQMITLVPRIQNVLIQAWVHSVMTHNKDITRGTVSSSAIHYDDTSLNLYDQLSLLHE